MAARRISMKQLHYFARKDRDFFEAFLKDPRKALAEKGVSLSPKNLQTIQKAIRKDYTISGKDLARLLMTGKEKTIVPWPLFRPWPGFRPWPMIRH